MCESLAAIVVEAAQIVDWIINEWWIGGADGATLVLKVSAAVFLRGLKKRHQNVDCAKIWLIMKDKYVKCRYFFSYFFACLRYAQISNKNRVQDFRLKYTKNIFYRKKST